MTPIGHKLLSTLLIAALTSAQSGALIGQTSATGNRLILRDGSDVKLKLLEPLSSKTAHAGDPVNLELAEDLRVNDLIVAREGSRATGEITVSKKAGMMGKGGDLAMQLFYLRAGDDKVKLRGTKGKEGDSKVGTAITLTVLLGVFGLMKHGKNAELPAGTTITAYVADDTPLLSLNAPPYAPVPPPIAPAADLAAGQVSIVSTPSGADIEIDGKFYGSTPAQVALPAGDHQVKVSAGGKIWERTLTVSGGNQLNLNANLQ
jgi:hypothetical protein